MTRAMTVTLSLLAACAPLGVGDDGGEAPSAARRARGTLVVELGTGATTFEPLQEGVELPIVAGPQGGHHLWAAIRVTDETVTRAAIRVHATLDDSGEPLGSDALSTVDLRQQGSYRERAGLTAFVADPAAASGKRVRLTVDVDDGAGLSGSATRVVVAR